MKIEGTFELDQENEDEALDLIYAMIEKERKLKPYLNLRFYTKK